MHWGGNFNSWFSETSCNTLSPRPIPKIETERLEVTLLQRERVEAPDIGTPTKHHPETTRSEEHTSELQSPCNLVCRLLLEKKHKLISELVVTDLRELGTDWLLCVSP